jgi:hypothetical protein
MNNMLTIPPTIPTGIPSPTIFRPEPDSVRRAIERRSVATLATSSSSGRPHAATVIYQAVEDVLFVSTSRESRKARNIAERGLVGVSIAVRRLPVGPPASIQFQSTATVLTNDDPEIVRLADTGRIDRITSHGELELEDGCFLRIPLPGRLLTYAIGMSLWHVMRHPLDAAGEVELR